MSLVEVEERCGVLRREVAEREQFLLDVVEQRIGCAVLCGLEVGRIHPSILLTLHCTTSHTLAALVLSQAR